MTPLPSGGVLDGTTHLLPLRVYYEDTDAGGIVYHANYLRYAERARTEMLRVAGIDLNRLKDEQGLIFVVYRGEIDYRRPARFDDRLLVVSDLVELGGATAVIHQAIRLLTPEGARGEETAVFRAHVACMHASGRPARFPKDLRARMESLIRRAPPVSAAAAPALTSPTG
jgi:acyl-CoA thioester hydrolase